jgi:hypothetical protein
LFKRISCWRSMSPSGIMRKSVCIQSVSFVAGHGERKRKFAGRHCWSTVVLRDVGESPTRYGEVVRARKNAAAIMVASARLGTDKTPRSPCIQRRTHETNSG